MKPRLIVAIFAIAAVPVCAEAQQSSIAQLKEDARNVVNIISSDKGKSQTYCQMEDLSDASSGAGTESNRIGGDIRSRICRVASQP